MAPDGPLRKVIVFRNAPCQRSTVMFPVDIDGEDNGRCIEEIPATVARVHRTDVAGTVRASGLRHSTAAQRACQPPVAGHGSLGTTV